MMRILITNDDGIGASQLPNLIRWCEKLGEVTVVVPKQEQSGKSHSIELHKPYECRQTELEGFKVWTVDSTPADCIRFAVIGLKKEFDLCISGINRGFNLGTDVVYSGTVGAASEAVALGLPAVALSTNPENYEQAYTQLDRIFDFIFENRLLDLCTLYNVNIPENPLGIRITRQGSAYYSDDYRCVGDGLYTACGKCVHSDNGDTTLDTNTTLNRYISISPLTIDKTNHTVFKTLFENKPNEV